MYIARNRSGALFLWKYEPHPVGNWVYKMESEQMTELGSFMELDSSLFPEVTFESGPVEVEITIKGQIAKSIFANLKYGDKFQTANDLIIEYVSTINDTNFRKFKMPDGRIVTYHKNKFNDSYCEPYANNNFDDLDIVKRL